MSYRFASRRALGFAVVVPLASAALGAAACFGPDQPVIWICLNPVTGKEDPSIGDANHYANGEPDPCHCYDPCGPQETCPIVVDAGPLGPGCDTGDGGP